MSELLFHIATAADWRSSDETYVPPQFGAERFIHCSTFGQLEGVAKRKFLGRDDLLVLSIDPTRVRSQIRYENLDGGSEQFPHIYGPLNADAVVGMRSLCVGQDGELLFGQDPVTSNESLERTRGG
jgi:uncharacterized protein (DUF952 family)